MLTGANQGKEGAADVAHGQQLAVGLDVVLHAVKLSEGAAHLDSSLEGEGEESDSKPRISFATVD